MMISLLFLVLTAWRLGNGEELVQLWARGIAHAYGYYEDRRQWQGPAAAIAVALVAGIVFRFLVWTHRWGVNNISIACLSAISLGGYTLIRSISFHPVDTFIYASIGPFRVNYCIDIGLSVICGACALGARRRTIGRGMPEGTD